MLEKKRIFDLLSTTSKPCLRQTSSMRYAVKISKEFKHMGAIPILDQSACPLVSSYV